MTKYEIWQDLREQVKTARKVKNDKLNEITTCEWTNKDKSCVKVYQIIQSVGVPTENHNDFSIKNCDNFSDEVCSDPQCKMYAKNKEYAEAMAVLKALKKEKHKAFWNMFTRSK